MEKIDLFFHYLDNGIPFALTRFNDGEVRGIFRLNDKVARGCQKITKELMDELRQAIQHRQERYWVGIPCPKCFPKWHEKASELVSDYENVTCAVVNTNRNLKRVWEELPKLFKNRDIVWVSGNDQNISALKRETGISVTRHITVPTKNAWREFENLKNQTIQFPQSSVVVLSCGPMAEPLIHHWYKARSETTFLDLGSTFDPYTRNVWHKCHTFKLKPCPYCN